MLRRLFSTKRSQEAARKNTRRDREMPRSSRVSLISS